MQSSSNEIEQELQDWLKQYLTAHQGVAGTVHLYAAASDLLTLAAHVNIPPPVVNITRQIPKGKGMAGLAWERQQSVQACNIQQDNPDVRPGAKAVSAQAAVAIPVLRSGQLYAVVGIAFMGEREIVGQELADLESAAAKLP